MGTMIDMIEGWAALQKRVTVGKIMRCLHLSARIADQAWSYLLVTGAINSAGYVINQDEKKGGWK